MLNQLCVEKNAHQWGVCLQICADCGVKDLHWAMVEGHQIFELSETYLEAN
jgi:hypothetical protein